MKKLTRLMLSFAAGLLIFTSCSDQNDGIAPSDDAAGKGKPSGTYAYGEGNVTASVTGNTLTLLINQAGKQNLSHLLLQATACEGDLLDVNDVISATVNGVQVEEELLSETGSGTGCAFESGAFIKFDNISETGLITIVIEFNQPISATSLLLKAGQACAAVNVPSSVFAACEPVQGSTETAFAKSDDGTCFSEFGIARWGWSNTIALGATEEWDVYAGAGQCDISKGTWVGTVTVHYDGSTVNVVWDIDPNYNLEEEHIYAGLTATPVNSKSGKPSVAPGQYTVGEFNNEASVYVIVHGVVSGI
jgi:hypothetical protein